MDRRSFLGKLAALDAGPNDLICLPDQGAHGIISVNFDGTFAHVTWIAPPQGPIPPGAPIIRIGGTNEPMEVSHS